MSGSTFVRFNKAVRGQDGAFNGVEGGRRLVDEIHPKYLMPQCPSCGLSLWGKDSHLANEEEVCLLVWYDRVRVVGAT